MENYALHLPPARFIPDIGELIIASNVDLLVKTGAPRSKWIAIATLFSLSNLLNHTEENPLSGILQGAKWRQMGRFFRDPKTSRYSQLLIRILSKYKISLNEDERRSMKLEIYFVAHILFGKQNKGLVDYISSDPRYWSKDNRELEDGDVIIRRISYALTQAYLDDENTKKLADQILHNPIDKTNWDEIVYSKKITPLDAFKAFYHLSRTQMVHSLDVRYKLNIILLYLIDAGKKFLLPTLHSDVGKLYQFVAKEEDLREVLTSLNITGGIETKLFTRISQPDRDLIKPVFEKFESGFGVYEKRFLKYSLESQDRTKNLIDELLDAWEKSFFETEQSLVYIMNIYTVYWMKLSLESFKSKQSTLTVPDRPNLVKFNISLEELYSDLVHGYEFLHRQIKEAKSHRFNPVKKEYTATNDHEDYYLGTDELTEAFTGTKRLNKLALRIRRYNIPRGWTTVPQNTIPIRLQTGAASLNDTILQKLFDSSYKTEIRFSIPENLDAILIKLSNLDPKEIRYYVIIVNERDPTMTGIRGPYIDVYIVTNPLYVSSEEVTKQQGLMSLKFLQVDIFNVSDNIGFSKKAVESTTNNIIGKLNLRRNGEPMVMSLGYSSVFGAKKKYDIHIVKALWYAQCRIESQFTPQAMGHIQKFVEDLELFVVNEYYQKKIVPHLK